MSFNKLLKQYQQETWETTNRKELEDDWGIQFATRKGKKTFATSYFYRSQNSTIREFENLKNWMLEHNYVLVGTSTVQFETNNWPKTSWARIEYTVEKN